MFSLGHTRSAHRADHLVQTPDTFIRAAWAGMSRAVAIVHASPTIGAGFTQYTVELEADGYVPPASVQRFVYVLSGDVQMGTVTLGPGGYAYQPGGEDSALRSTSGARATVIEKPYVPLPGADRSGSGPSQSGAAAPAAFSGVEHAIASQPVLGDADLQVRSLVPADVVYDFAVNTLAYNPGASLPMVEVHVMEHGLLFLEGGGIYRLGDAWYPVTEGDFIYMAPWCPQWFGAIGKTPAKYLIYKDWNRAAL
jgi:(S)-ureidoglycine aminohydrolase